MFKGTGGILLHKGSLPMCSVTSIGTAAAAAAPRLTQYTLEDYLLCNQIRICAFKQNILQ